MLKPSRIELIIIVLVAILLAVWVLLPRPEGTAVQVSVDGQIAMILPLTESARVPVEGYGGYSTVLVIENGCAHVEDSTCPDLVCQHHAPISGSGNPIVCLPGHIVISVTEDNTEDTEEAIDAVAK